MKRVAGLILIVVWLSSGAITQAAPTGQTPTVYGKGAEIHLLPSWGRFGSLVHVYGLGYRPRAVVRLLPGYFGGEYLNRAVTRVRATASGSFNVSFRITCDLVYVDFYHRGPRTRCSVPGRSADFPIIFLGAPSKGHAGPGAREVFDITRM